MAATADLQVRDKVFIGGEWVEPEASGTLEVVNSTSEEAMGSIPACTAADADRAVAAARDAFESWSQTSREERAGYMSAISAGLAERMDEIAATISQELGMPLTLSKMIQAGLPIAQFGAMPKLLEEVRWEEEIGNSRVLREPVGVLGAITPWNYPLNQIACKVAPALAAGCTVVLKPSEIVPLNAFILAEVIEAAGPSRRRLQPRHRHRPDRRRGDRRPPRRRHGLLHRLDPRRSPRFRARLGDGEAGRDGARWQVAERDPRRRRPEQGRARRSRQVLPQLGPDLQRPDPDARAAREAGRSRADRHRRRRRASPPATPSRTRPGSARSSPRPSASGCAATSRRARPRERSCSPAAPTAPEGLDKGYFVRPTVFSEVTPEMTIAQEEIFGPVLAIQPYDGEDDAVRIANDTDYGLAGGVWSADQERAIAVAKKIRTGQIEINGGAFNPLAPFGGYKQSGHGRENGRYAIEELLQVKSLQL